LLILNYDRGGDEVQDSFSDVPVGVADEFYGLVGEKTGVVIFD
jgi:hypothetical protein